MRRSLLALSIAAVLSAPAFGQAAADPAPLADASVPLTYVGANARVSVGVNQDGDFQGELLGILGDDGDSAWLGQLWKGQGNAGGAQLDYHWLLAGKTRQDTIDNPDSVRVAKAFVAYDQNAWKDSKATLGLGYQKDDFFLDGYVSAATSGTRRAGSFTDVVTNTLTGSENGHPYTQTQTVTTVTDFFEHPYDHGLGVRLGEYFDDSLLRVRGGLDYERGKHSVGADQLTVSAGIDKYFRNTGWSLSLDGEHLRKSGDFETDKSDTRGWLTLRYEFGQSFRPKQPYRSVQVEQPSADKIFAPEPQVVRNEVKLDGDAFFDFDHAELRPDAVAALDELLAKLKSNQRVSRISVIGHTDSIGTDAYNQALSERRAASAKRYLVAHGIAADEIEARGEGEKNPSFPNDTAASRQKNRRVDVEFLTIEETTTTPPPAPEKKTVEWVKEPVAAPAAWIERALRNPAEHKRTVDVYRFDKSASTTTLGDKQFGNGAPQAVDDTVQLTTCPASLQIRVLDNDTDPDHDTLKVVSTNGASKGVVTIGADGVLTYTPRPGTVSPPVCDAAPAGGDTFTYTITDSFGATSSATVRILPPGTSPPTGNAPTAVDDYARVLKGYGADIDVLANDSDPDGDRLRVISVERIGTFMNATVSINPDGTVRYQHYHGTLGEDSFRYTITDDHGHTASAIVHVSVWEIGGG